MGKSGTGCIFGLLLGRRMTLPLTFHPKPNQDRLEKHILNQLIILNVLRLPLALKTRQLAQFYIRDTKLIIVIGCNNLTRK